MQPTDTPDDALLPWPRTADDGTPLGIDLAAWMRREGDRPPYPDTTATSGDQRAYDALRCLVLGYVSKRPTVQATLDESGIEADDLVQMVSLAVARKNHQGCAWDRRRASFSKYITLVTRSAVANLRADRAASPDVCLDESAVLGCAGEVAGADELLEAAERPTVASTRGRVTEAKIADGVYVQPDLFGEGFTVSGKGFAVRYSGKVGCAA